MVKHNIVAKAKTYQFWFNHFLLMWMEKEHDEIMALNFIIHLTTFCFSSRGRSAPPQKKKEIEREYMFCIMFCIRLIIAKDSGAWQQKEKEREKICYLSCSALGSLLQGTMGAYNRKRERKKICYLACFVMGSLSLGTMRAGNRKRERERKYVLCHVLHKAHYC